MKGSQTKYAIGVDLGGTKTLVGVVDENGHLHEKVWCATQAKEGPEQIQKKIIQEISQLKSQLKGQICGIGVGVAGQVDLLTGNVLFAPNLFWHDVPLQSNFEKALELPVGVFNDVRAATFGEWLFGAGKGCQDILCVFVGTGIGSGVVSQGHLLTGSSNTFGEVGHMSVDINGPLCTCGRRGCLEAFVGGWGISERAKQALLKNPDEAMLDLVKNVDKMTAEIICKAALQGNPWAKAFLKESMEILACGFANLINLYNPSRLIVGGGLAEGMPELIEFLDKKIREEALKAATSSLTVHKAHLGNLSGVIGAAAGLFHRYQKDLLSC